MLQAANILAVEEQRLLNYSWEMSEKTLAQPIFCRGIGIHSGRRVSVHIEPAPVGTGIQFRRNDIKANGDE